VEGHQRLESWKKISAYLGWSVKTCQRWETDLGLPVHRFEGTPRARVFADPAELDAWIREKMSGPVVEQSKRADARRVRFNRISFVTAAGILLVGGASLAWRNLVSPPPVFPPDTVVLHLLPVENRTGDPGLDAWQTTVPQLISMDLTQSRIVSCASMPSLLKVLEILKLQDVRRYSDEDLKKICQKLRVGFMATGSLARSGADTFLELNVYDVKTAGRVGSCRSRFSGQQGIFAAVDAVSPQLKLAMRIPKRLVAADLDDKVEKISTSSLEALELLCRGEQLAWRNQAPDSVQAFQQALKIDPHFAEASLQLYWSSHEAGQDEAKRAGQRVLASIDRLCLCTRLQFEADFYGFVQLDAAKCVAALKKSWEIFSDRNAGYFLADRLFGLEDIAGATPIMEALEARVPLNPDYRELLAYCYASGGQVGQAEMVIDEYLAKAEKPQTELFNARSNIALQQLKFDVALSWLDRMYAAYPRSMYAVRYSKGVIYFTQDDLAAAENEFRRIVSEGTRDQRSFGSRFLMAVSLCRGQVNDARTYAREALQAAQDFGDPTFVKEAHYYLAYLERLSGNFAAALPEAELACQDYFQEGPPGVRPLQLKALILLDLDRMDEFLKLAADLKAFIQKIGYPKLMRAHDYLLGQREMKLKNWEGAVSHFWKAASLLPSDYANQGWDADPAQYWYALAEAYDRAGACPAAQNMFERISPLWDQRPGCGDLYVRSFYRIAKLQESCGKHPMMTGRESQTEKVLAMKNYQKFLSLWKDADPLFAAEVEDATRRLEALQAELAPAKSLPER
jgi:tetratricopeptide (TPR) repeat protein